MAAPLDPAGWKAARAALPARAAFSALFESAPGAGAARLARAVRARVLLAPTDPQERDR